MECDDRPHEVQGNVKQTQLKNGSESTLWSIRSGSKAIWAREWTDWFEGLTITLEEDGDTLLTGPVVDQAASAWLAEKSA